MPETLIEKPVKKIGVIADTHGYLDPEAEKIFAGVDLILHAGDVGANEVIVALEKIAPVVAVCGNHEDEITSKLKWLETITVDKIKIAVTHQFLFMNMEMIFNMPAGWQHKLGLADVRIMVFGHSHEPFSIESHGALYFNPGYSGPDMTEPLRTVGIISIENEKIDARVYFLNPPPRDVYLDKAEFFKP